MYLCLIDIPFKVHWAQEFAQAIPLIFTHMIHKHTSGLWTALYFVLNHFFFSTGAFVPLRLLMFQWIFVLCTQFSVAALGASGSIHHIFFLIATSRPSQLDLCNYIKSILPIWSMLSHFQPRGTELPSFRINNLAIMWQLRAPNLIRALANWIWDLSVLFCIPLLEVCNAHASRNLLVKALGHQYIINAHTLNHLIVVIVWKFE